MRKLASVQVVSAVESIPGSDFIEKIQVLGWSLIAKKGEFEEGDLCVFFEIDSVLPEDIEAFEFMRSRKFRVRTLKMRGIVSQGLALSPDVLNVPADMREIDTDLTEFLRVVKYVPKRRGYNTRVRNYKPAGTFPKAVPKTNELRLQSNPRILKDLYGKKVYVSTKMDGSSMTVVRLDNRLTVASRNIERVYCEVDPFWQAALMYDLENVVPEGVAIQGELCGVGIQGNRAGIEDVDFFVFNILDVKGCRYWGLQDMVSFCSEHGLKFVEHKIIENFPYKDVFDTQALLELAKGKYSNGHAREGIVIRTVEPVNGNLVSGKVIDPNYLLQINE